VRAWRQRLCHGICLDNSGAVVLEEHKRNIGIQPTHFSENFFTVLEVQHTLLSSRMQTKSLCTSYITPNCCQGKPKLGCMGNL
jgi:hypothetical protein